ncbi:MAG TPA: hypothetical protein VF198_18685 [Vicinamibacterales bacterium]
MRDMPIACTLGPGELAAGRDGLLPGLIAKARAVEPLADGLRLQFEATGDTLSAATRVIDAERQCCRFLRFQLTVEQDGGPITLDVTGPAGTREFLLDLCQ